jgi:hypothetical protein
MVVDVPTDKDGTSRPQGAGYDIGAYELIPALTFGGVSGDGVIHLFWIVNVSLPADVTWVIAYSGGPGTPLSPITGILRDTRAYPLGGLTINQLYTVILTAMDGSMPILSGKVDLMPAEHFIYMPRIMQTNFP